jgi:type IV secretory pathway VirD2 relaxase
MTTRDDERFRIRPKPPRSRGGSETSRFVSKVIREASRAGVATTGTKRASSTFGRGRVAARLGTSLGPRARRVVIKSRLVNLRKAGRESVTTHLRYIVRDGVTRGGGRAAAYGPRDDVDLEAFEKRNRGDRHQFRFIVSVEDAAEIEDLRDYTRSLMERMTTDLETRLDWIAVDHWDTDNPHTHVVLRGKASDGRDLLIAPDYLAHGMRRRAMELATEWLGPRTELEIRQAMRREVDQERFTSLDRALLRQAEGNYIDFTESGAETGEVGLALRARLQRLEAWGLAKREGPTDWQLSTSLEPTLTRMGERGDILKAMHRALGERRREQVIRDLREPSTIVGRIAGKGIADELGDRGYLVVDGTEGRGHYVPLPASVDIGDFPVGGIVEIGGGARGHRADGNIAQLARDGMYRTSDHMAVLVTKGRSAADADDIVSGHVRRLEALRRAGIVTRVEEGLWQVPDNLPGRGALYDQQRSAAHVELVCHLPIERQTTAIGATWLDRQLVNRDSPIAEYGFGEDVTAALRARATFLVEQGFAQRVGSNVVVGRDLLMTLQRRELDAAGQALTREHGLTYRATGDDERITGVYRRSVLLASGRFAMLDDGLGFSLVPWRPMIEPRLGQTMTTVLRGGVPSWEFGKQRSPGIG